MALVRALVEYLQLSHVRTSNFRGSVYEQNSTPVSRTKLAEVMSTLIANGFSSSNLGSTNVGTITDYLEKQLLQGNGLVGFGKQSIVYLQLRLYHLDQVAFTPD